MAVVTVKLLDRKHPEWSLRTDEWENLRLLYEGAIELKNNLDNFLPRRMKEMFDVYYERGRRFTYQNVLQAAIGWYMGKLFENDPQIRFGQNTDEMSDGRWAAFLEDCDNCGTTFVEFGKKLLEMMMLYRRGFVLIDKRKPDPDAPVSTRADEQRQKLDQPYLVLYEPQKIFNWSLDQYGNVQWIVIKTVEERQEDPLGDVQRIAHWWIFNKTQFWHYQFVGPKNDNRALAAFWKDSILDEDHAVPELVQSGPHVMAAFGQVPVRPCELPTHLWFPNRAYLQILEHIDTYNSHTWKLFMCNYPQLVIQSEREIKGVTKSEASYIKLDPNDKISYLEPGAESLKVSADQLEKLRQEIYRAFHLQAQGRPSTASADGASGYSKEQEMAPAVDMLAAIGDVLRAQQQLVLVDYKNCAGMPSDGDNLPDVNGYEFETKPIMGAIEVAQSLQDLGVPDKSPTLEKFLDKKVALAAMDGANETDRQSALSEIDKAPTRSEQKTQEQQAQQQAFEQRFQRMTATGVLQNEAAAVAA